MLIKFQSLKARKRPKKLVELRLGTHAFAVDAEQVIEVVGARNLVTVAEGTASILGVVNVRGNVIPVGDIRPRLGLPLAEIDLSSRVIILDAAGLYLGLFADSVGNRLIEPDDNAWITDKEPTPDLPPLRGFVHLDAGDIPVIDCEQVFTAEEKSALENVTKSF